MCIPLKFLGRSWRQKAPRQGREKVTSFLHLCCCCFKLANSPRQGMSKVLHISLHPWQLHHHLCYRPSVVILSSLSSLCPRKQSSSKVRGYIWENSPKLLPFEDPCILKLNHIICGRGLQVSWLFRKQVHQALLRHFTALWRNGIICLHKWRKMIWAWIKRQKQTQSSRTH